MILASGTNECPFEEKVAGAMARYCNKFMRLVPDDVE